MKHSESITTIAPALVAALAEIKSVTKDAKNPFLKNKYASLDAIIEASRPVLAAHELTAMQIVNDDGIETIILHASGEWISSDYIKIMPEVSKGLSLAQSVGVATTYAKRYQLGAILNISTDEDTDGQYGDNSELKPEAHEADNRPWMREQDFNKLVERIIKGELDVYEKADEYYRMKKEYRVGLKDAMTKVPVWNQSINEEIK